MRWTHLIIHHTASKPGITADELRAMHKARGFKDIGYHYVVYRSAKEDYTRGHLKAARPDTQPGAHAGITAWNRKALGLSVAGYFHGGSQHTETLDPKSLLFYDVVAAVLHVCRKYGIPAQSIRGHREVKATACPGENFPLAAVKEHVAAALKARPE